MAETPHIPLLAVGYISEDARAFLTAHNTPVASCNGLQVIALDRASGGGINRTLDSSVFVLGFYVDDEHVDEDVLILHLNVDASESKIILRQNYWSIFESEPGPVM